MILIKFWQLLVSTLNYNQEKGSLQFLYDAFFFETGSCDVAQAGLEFVISCLSLLNAGITGMQCHVQPCTVFYLRSFCIFLAAWCLVNYIRLLECKNFLCPPPLFFFFCLSVCRQGWQVCIKISHKELSVAFSSLVVFALTAGSNTVPCK
jgi:hypothetical protein